MTRIATWRELGKPEAAVVGAQYVANDRGQRKAPYVVRASGEAEWVFAGTGLEPGSKFGRFGIENRPADTALPTRNGRAG